MKQVLIISYFFPPANFVGGQRIEYWAKNLHHFGYYPVVVTRNWNEGQTTLTEEINDNELKIETHETHEIHRVPFDRTLRDKIADKKGMKIFQKALTFWELIASNFSVNALPYKNLYSYCEKLLSSGEITVLIASGRPFQTFQFGYKLKKKFDIIWVPDYRDEWNSHYRTPIQNPFLKFISFLERRSEKKWVSNSDLFLSVSEIWVDRIAKFNDVNGQVVKNGYDAIIPKSKREDQILKVLYAGTLYPYQDISIITEAIRSLNHPQIKFFFIGSCESVEMRNYLEELQQTYPDTFHLSQKVPKESFEKLIGHVDIGILAPYQNLSGCLPVKIFDYYAHGLELLLCPSDNDLMAQFIDDTKSGRVVNNQEECEAFLKERLQAKLEGSLDIPRNYELGKEYHRLYQTEVLAKTLDALQKDS